jgi:hypothetical protein
MQPDEIAQEDTTLQSESKVIALPTTVQGLMDLKKSKTKKSLHDQVEAIHLQLWVNGTYRKFLDAVYNSQAVEGSMIADDFEAARMIREEARENGNHYVAEQNLTTLKQSLGVVMRRFGVSRKERAER